MLGATAIEDRLQDGVPETIADLELAGIKAWGCDWRQTENRHRHWAQIASEANLIVVRGERGGLSVFDLLYNAAEEYFPEARILKKEALDIGEKHGKVKLTRRSMSDSVRNRGGERLHRVNTDVSSTVGSQNGERAGGFVLVIEGTALQHVSITLKPVHPYSHCLF